MGLTNITGVFSRYFVVGFFLPAYIALVSLWVFASRAFIPNTLESHSQATQVLILGAIALVSAMALSGVNYYITRIYEGYPLAQAVDPLEAGKLSLAAIKWLGLKRLHQRVIARQRRRYDRLCAIRDDKNNLPSKRGRAAWRLEKWFPKSRDALLPTRVGNALRAAEQHSNVRWGLDGITMWPRIEALLGADEREQVVDAKTNFYVFVNASVGAFAVAICLVIDKAVNNLGSGWEWPLYLIPFGTGYILYRGAISPAIEWGDSIRSSIDLHRLELYEKLGVRAPISFSDERQLAAKVNKALLFGHPLLADDLWRGEKAENDRG
jgi:hypothetical protein